MKNLYTHIYKIIKPIIKCTDNQYATAAYLYFPDFVFTDLLNKKIQAKVNVAYKLHGDNITEISKITNIDYHLVNQYILYWKKNGDQLSPEHQERFHLKYDDYLDNKITTEEYGSFVFGMRRVQQLLFLHMQKNNMVGPGHYRSVKYDAVKRGKKWEINGTHLSNVLNQQELKCKLSGLPIRSYYYDRYRIGVDIFSIDRVDSNKHYSPDNIQLVRSNINFAKHILTNEEFYKMCCRVVLTGIEERNLNNFEELAKYLESDVVNKFTQKIDLQTLETKEFQKMTENQTQPITLEFTGSF